MEKCKQICNYNHNDYTTTIKFFLGNFHCMSLVIQDGKVTEKSYIRFKLPKVLGGETISHHFTKTITGTTNSELYSLYKLIVQTYFDAHSDKKLVMQEYHLGKALKWC